jgi:hypothetical protein
MRLCSQTKPKKDSVISLKKYGTYIIAEIKLKIKLCVYLFVGVDIARN